MNVLRDKTNLNQPIVSQIETLVDIIIPTKKSDPKAYTTDLEKQIG